MPERYFIIGDVHGCAKTLESLLFSVCKITPNDSLVFIGDLIDKGPDSKTVLDIILDLKEKNYKITFIRGNHEQMMINSLDSSKAMKDWFRNGGKNTLDSFDAFHPGFLDDKYINFILESVFYVETEKYIIVHAGMDFNIPNPFINKEKMLTIRNDAIDKNKTGGRKLIVGHTPTPLEKIKSSLWSDIIKIDGGCVYYKNIQDLGNLVALELKSHELFYLQNIDYDYYEV